jgi:26S proteasome regulatory subunit N13
VPRPLPLAHREMSLFAAGRADAGPRPLVQFKVGKMALSGTTLTPDKRKGELAITQSEDGLMHVTWTGSASSSPEDDLIVFPNEVVLKRVAQVRTQLRCAAAPARLS